MSAKPKYRFCWVCSRKLHGAYFREVVIDGQKRVVHKACSGQCPPGFESADDFYLRGRQGALPGGKP